jgi:hypothetical protein
VGEIYRDLVAPTAIWVNLGLLNADSHLKGGSGILKTRFPNSRPAEHCTTKPTDKQ